MLKNRLEELLADKERGCPMEAFIKTLDEETADSFKRVMASGVGNQTIYLVMRDEGYKISRPSIEQARGCFRGTKECKCGSANGSKK
jgi:hypothetical protein